MTDNLFTVVLLASIAILVTGWSSLQVATGLLNREFKKAAIACAFAVIGICAGLAAYGLL